MGVNVVVTAVTIAILFFSHLCTKCQAQQERQVAPGIDYYTIFTVSADNRLAFFEIFSPIGPRDAKQAGWLKDDAVRFDLDLTDEQSSSLENVVNRLKELRARMGEVARSEASGVDEKTLKEQFTPVVRDRDVIANDLKGLLIAPQQAALSRIHLRKELVDLGLATALDGWIFQKLGLEKTSSDRLRDVLFEQRKAIDTLRSKMQKEWVNSVLEVLTDSQREQLEAQIGSPVKYCASSMELMLWQLEHPLSHDKQVTTELQELARTPECFELSLSGSLEPVDTLVANRFGRFVDVCTRGYYGNVEIVSSQIGEAILQSEEAQDEAMALRERLSSITQRFLEREISYEEHGTLASKELEAFEQWKVDRFVRVLLPHQQYELRTIVLRRLITLRGLHACLADGALGKKLEVTADQAKRLEALAKKSLEPLRHELSELDNKVWSEVRNALTDQDRRAFDEAIGTPSRKHLPTCGFLLK